MEKANFENINNLKSQIIKISKSLDMNNIQRAILKKEILIILLSLIILIKKGKRIDISPMIKKIKKKEKNQKFKYKFTICLIILLGFIATYN